MVARVKATGTSVGMEQPSIKAIDKVSVARICSGQVITDLATAVKELVENSLVSATAVGTAVRGLLHALESQTSIMVQQQWGQNSSRCFGRHLNFKPVSVQAGVPKGRCALCFVQHDRLDYCPLRRPSRKSSLFRRSRYYYCTPSALHASPRPRASIERTPGRNTSR